MERKIGEIFEFEGVKLQAVKKNKSRGLCIDYYNDEVGYFGSDKDYNEFGTIGADDCDASSTPLKDKLFNLLVWVRKNYGNR